ncbi:hypothetical protein SPRG_01671 [Saprolegnia parasitica CBS 223.65]|uniref:Cytochrome P450 n=1 Tax=Saprolegnia parasitica (strain CBS 223.65) TaxID=695850 RepID=A0A067D445_SAPPC|nr:hypothetical protein SPRG_01671 [Saprolegnia parasitica CBS 223.65]KDO33792.1 hypothetical protein SPRG_01671 [Saprolegnia parasitica CBS 223.65]|eukprot:XP_012195428.1 hypothetical protein SPRG_01671 [Saprolegnia parasitica CBS 223.65]
MADVDSRVAVAALTGGLALVGFRTLRRSQVLTQALPGPRRTSIVYGNAREFGKTRWHDGQRFPEPFVTWQTDFGGAFYYRVFWHHRVNLSDPTSLQHVFVVNAANYPRASIPRALFQNLLGGDGLLSSEDPAHAAQRKRLNPHFAQSVFKAYIPVFAAETETLGKTLDSLTGPVSVPNLMTRLTLNIIGKTAFGYDFKTLDPTNDQAAIVLSAFEKLNTPPRFLYTLGLTLLPGFQHWPLPYLRQIQAAKATLFRIVDDVIAHKVTSPSRDLLDLLLADAAMTAAEARVHVMTFMFAGHETTSNTLSWVLAMLATHPTVEAAVVDECRRALADAGGTVSWQTLGDLPLLTATIYETLRLYPTAPFITTRHCVADDSIPRTDDAPFFMPAGAHVSFSVGAIHRNPLYWTDPDAFVPQRFLDDSTQALADKALRNGKGNTFTYMPFSAGAKNCIGKRFAVAEMQTVLLQLLPTYAFTLAPDANLHPKLTGVTIKPSNLVMHVSHRAASCAKGNTTK